MISIMTLTNTEARTGVKHGSRNMARPIGVQALEPAYLGANLHTTTLELSHRKSPGSQSGNRCSNSPFTA